MLFIFGGFMSNLIKCADCGKKVGMNASSCLKCGSILSQQPGFNDKKNALIRKKQKELEDIERSKIILCWIVVFIVGFIGLGIMVSSFVYGLLIILSGILISPPIKSHLASKNILSNKVINYIGLTIAFLCFMFGSMQADMAQQDRLNSSPAATVSDDNKASDLLQQTDINETPLAENINKETDKEIKAEKELASPDITEVPPEVTLSSESFDSDFLSCIQQQNEFAEIMLSSGNYKVIPVVQTGILTIFKYCTNDGAILYTCSKEDRKMIVTKTPNKTGC